MKIEVFKENLRNAMLFLPDQLANNAGDAMEDARRTFVSKFQRDRLNFPKSGPVQPKDGGLRRVTGSLSRSFQSRTWRGNLDHLKTSHWSAGVPYARIHEFGDNSRGIPPRLGFYSSWEDHIHNDLMPRLERATAKTIKDAGFKSRI